MVKLGRFPKATAVLASLVASSLAFSSTHYSSVIRHTSTPTKQLGTISRLGSSQKNDATMEDSLSAMTGEILQDEEDFTVTFPPLRDLEDVIRGDFLASKPITVQGKHEFRVLLYPRGGGHSSSSTSVNGNNNTPSEGGLGDLFQSKQDAAKDRVGVYLQYLPKHSEDTVDATFNLRLKGKQTSTRRFDVDWTAGMRFVGPDRGNLRDGTANDFGAHMMQSFLLEGFLGGEDSHEALDIVVKVKVHPDHQAAATTTRSATTTESSEPSLFSFQDIRETKDPNLHDSDNVRVGKIVVPILKNISQRPRMFEIGAYPGVEYRMMRILHPETGEDIFASMPGADYEIKPLYPLVPQLERQWPVRVNERELPKLGTVTMYNVISAVGSLFTAVTGLTTAFVISQLISFFFIPSKSMDPTLRVGDVLLVEKVTPRVFKNPNVGDVVLFNPNSKLQDIVKANGGRISDRDLFVKRVAAGPGDSVSVDMAGSVTVNGKPVSGKRDLCEEEPLRLIQKYVKPVDKLEISKDQVFVMGDCSSVSVDSRVWGPLNKEDIVGRPILRIWPLGSLGSVPAIPPSTASVNGQITTESKEMLVTNWN